MINEYDEWNKVKRELHTLVQNLTHINPLIMGLGVPTRHPSYILGRPIEHGS